MFVIRRPLLQGLIRNRSLILKLNPPIISTCQKCIKRPTFSTSRTENKIKDSSVSTIYTGDMTSLVKRIKYFSFANTTLGILVTPYFYVKSMEVGGVPLMVTLCGLIGFFSYVTPFLLHIVARNYVTHLDYDSKNETYTAWTLSFFLQPKKIEFTSDDVVVPDVPGMFTTFKIRGKPVLINLKKFDSLEHYERIMGYDKPLELMTREDEKDEKKK